MKKEPNWNLSVELAVLISMIVLLAALLVVSKTKFKSEDWIGILLVLIFFLQFFAIIITVIITDRNDGGIAKNVALLFFWEVTLSIMGIATLRRRFKRTTPKPKLRLV